MANEWHYARNGSQYGPINARDLKLMASSGKLRPTDTVWKSGMTEPVTASRVKGLFSTLDDGSSVPPPLPTIAAAASNDSFGAVSSRPELPTDGYGSYGIGTPYTDDSFDDLPVDATAFATDSSGPANASARGAHPTVSLVRIPDRLRRYIQNRETVLYASNPSSSARVLSMILVSAIPGVPLIFFLLGAILAGEFTTLILGLIAGLLLVSLFAYIAHLHWKHQYYIITDSRTIVSQGIFNIAVRVVFNRNIQMIAVNTGLIDRWLDLNSVELSTASSGGGMRIFAAFPGLSPGNVQLRWVSDAPNVVGLISS